MLEHRNLWWRLSAYKGKPTSAFYFLGESQAPTHINSGKGDYLRINFSDIEGALSCQTNTSRKNFFYNNPWNPVKKTESFQSFFVVTINSWFFSWPWNPTSSQDLIFQILVVKHNFWPINIKTSNKFMWLELEE